MLKQTPELMVSTNNYFSQVGGLPPQTNLLSSKAVFKTAYAVIPRTVMSDIVTSALPHWIQTRAWILSRPRWCTDHSAIMV